MGSVLQTHTGGNLKEGQQVQCAKLAVRALAATPESVTLATLVETVAHFLINHPFTLFNRLCNQCIFNVLEFKFFVNHPVIDSMQCSNLLRSFIGQNVFHSMASPGLFNAALFPESSIVEQFCQLVQSHCFLNVTLLDKDPRRARGAFVILDSFQSFSVVVCFSGDARSFSLSDVAADVSITQQ